MQVTSSDPWAAMPLVSIVIPTYNHAHFLGRAIESVLAQTYTNWEIFVVDNHSEDDTDSVLERFRDQRMRVLKIHNGGVIAKSRNLGIVNSSGEWIAFLDSDDVWYPRKLEVTVGREVAASQVDVVCNDETVVDVGTGRRRRLRYGPFEDRFYERMLVDGNRVSTSATVVRRDFLLRTGLTFNESPYYVTVEDYDLWLRLALAGGRFRFVGDVQGEYLIHGGNSTARTAQHLANLRRLLRHHVYEVQRFADQPDKLWRRIDARLNLMEAWQHLLNGRIAYALRVATTAGLTSPYGVCATMLSRVQKYFARHLHREDSLNEHA